MTPGTISRSSIQRWTEVVRAMSGRHDVIATGRAHGTPRHFGAVSLRVRGKIFAAVYRGNLVVKLPRPIVNNHVSKGEGTNWDPARRGPFREWLQVDPDSRLYWPALAENAWDFARHRMPDRPPR